MSVSKPISLLAERRIKFRHLSCFLEVKAHSSFTIAAEVLRLTQPAVSKAITELEEILGISLFTRNRSGVSLSLQGEIFSRYASHVMISLRQGLNEVLQDNKSHNMLISVGVQPTVMGNLMPEVILAAKKQSFNITPKIIVGPNDYLLKMLKTGNIDLTVGRLSSPDDMQGLIFEQLYSDKIVFVVRPQHPLATHLSPLFLSELTPYTMILPPGGAIIRPIIDQMMIAHGMVGFPDVIETVAPVFAQHYTLMSDAIWIISRGVILDEIKAQKLIPLPIHFNENSGPVGITIKADKPSSLATTLIIQVIREVIKLRSAQD